MVMVKTRFGGFNWQGHCCFGENIIILLGFCYVKFLDISAL